MDGICTLGVGCDETGVCYAQAHGHPEKCGWAARPNPEVDSPAWRAEQERLTGVCAWCRGSGAVRTRDFHDELSTVICSRCKGRGVVGEFEGS